MSWLFVKVAANEKMAFDQNCKTFELLTAHVKTTGRTQGSFAELQAGHAFKAMDTYSLHKRFFCTVEMVNIVGDKFQFKVAYFLVLCECHRSVTCFTKLTTYLTYLRRLKGH